MDANFEKNNEDIQMATVKYVPEILVSIFGYLPRLLRIVSGAPYDF
jgi:hypothetical protein